jgi:hypothetical protein
MSEKVIVWGSRPAGRRLAELGKPRVTGRAHNVARHCSCAQFGLSPDDWAVEIVLRPSLRRDQGCWVIAALAVGGWIMGWAWVDHEPDVLDADIHVEVVNCPECKRKIA